MFRDVYLSATTYTTVKEPDFSSVKSELFHIHRGVVVQGGITYPLYFILVIEEILLSHDDRLDKGVSLGETIVHTVVPLGMSTMRPCWTEVMMSA